MLLAGNDYSTEVETGRNDAGIGLFLIGIGDGTFKSVSAENSGFYIPGDVKAMEEITINQKPCFVVSKNRDRLQLVKSLHQSQ